MTVIYTSLTDNELRLAIDNAPQDIAIRDEVVKRFLHGKSLDEARQESYDDGHKAGYDEGYEQCRIDVAEEER